MYTDRPLLERTWPEGNKGIFTGFGTSKGILISGKKSARAVANALHVINQRAVCAACEGGCDSHQAKGVPVGMNFHFSTIGK